jgi:1,4-dihydroxy-2-naphthoate octaprenyltransferase
MEARLRSPQAPPAGRHLALPSRAIAGLSPLRAAAASRWCRLRRPAPRIACSAGAAAAPFPGQPPPEGGAARPLLSPDGIIDPDGTVVKQAPPDPEQLRLLWKAAVKAPMYSVGLMPILVSAAAAYVGTGAFAPLRTLGFLASAVAIIAWLNLSNDVFDSMTGVDSAQRKPESVVNLTGSRWRVFLGAHAALLSGGALLFGLLAAVVSGPPRACVLG